MLAMMTPVVGRAFRWQRVIDLADQQAGNPVDGVITIPANRGHVGCVGVDKLGPKGGRGGRRVLSGGETGGGRDRGEGQRNEEERCFHGAVCG